MTLTERTSRPEPYLRLSQRLRFETPSHRYV